MAQTVSNHCCGGGEMKYYFDKTGDEKCYNKEYFFEIMRFAEMTGMKLNEAVRETNVDYFFCKEFNEVGEKGNCGKQCDKYIPNNGKNGRCKHYGYCYTVGKELILKLKK